MATLQQEPHFAVELTFYAIRIFCNDLLHLHIRRNEFMGLQSWKDGDKYSIEYTLRDGKSILSEYALKESWESILRSLAPILKNV